MILLLGGCFGVLPFRDEAPVLEVFNGMVLGVRRSGGAFPVVEEPLPEELPIELEVSDPERDQIRVWFPYISGEMDFDPDGTQGVWYPPDFDLVGGERQLVIVLEDDRNPPARSSWTFYWEGDTGGG